MLSVAQVTAVQLRLCYLFSLQHRPVYPCTHYYPLMHKPLHTLQSPWHLTVTLPPYRPTVTLPPHRHPAAPPSPCRPLFGRASKLFLPQVAIGFIFALFGGDVLTLLVVFSTPGEGKKFTHSLAIVWRAGGGACVPACQVQR